MPHQEDLQAGLSVFNKTFHGIEKETSNHIAFLDVLIIWKEHGFKPSVYYKPTFTGQYWNFNFIHPYSVKKLSTGTNSCCDPDRKWSALKKKKKTL